MIFEGPMIILAVTAMTVFHPVSVTVQIANLRQPANCTFL
jgi:hypothetical protein